MICPNAGVTVLLAILVALGVPFAQLHTVNDRVTCCCPDPDHCKCPDHKPDDSGQSQMGTCHKQSAKTARGHLAAFVPPARIELVAAAQPALHIAHALPVPHAPPPPRRPDAPS